MKITENKHRFFLVGIIILCWLFMVYGQANIQVEKISEGFQFVEGPVWKDNGLLFSDIPANTIYRWTPDSVVTEFLTPSGNSNGLALDLEGHLLLAQHGKRQIARLEADGSETPLATHYQDKRLNSPNDIAVKSDGSIFFTDPPYGISQDQEELGFYGIYRLSPSGSLQLLDKTLQRPNGITFSPDETKLYVSDAEAKRIYVWDVQDDTLIVNKQQFAHMNVIEWGSGSDGMKVDSEGRLFATGPIGVWVYNPNGTPLDTIEVPGQTTNCNWGDTDGHTLYITSGSALFRIRNIYTHIPDEKNGHIKLKPFQFYGNYPNPFNPFTIISYKITRPTLVVLKVYDIIGKEMEILVNEFQKTGIYKVKWKTEIFPSGVYLCKIQTVNNSPNSAQEFSETRKLILIK